MSRTHSSRSGRPYGTYDPAEVHEQLWAGFGGVMGWDIGANQGQSVDRMITQFDRVIAFEPAWESFVALAQDWTGHPCVQFYQLAMSCEPGALELSVCPHAIAGGQLLSASLVGSGQTSNPWFSGETGRRTVQATTLDLTAEEHGHPDFVKIDTEGAELDVLAGGRKLIAAGCDFLVEFHSPALLAGCLDALAGYRAEVITAPGAGGQNGWIRAWPIR